MEKIHTQAYTVRNYETGPHQVVHVRTLLDYLQETADSHVRERGATIQDLMKKGLYWIISAYQLEVARYPRAGETVTVNTWYPGRHDRFYLRDFLILGPDSAPIAAATTSWALIDKAKGTHMNGEGPIPDLPLLEKRAIEGGLEYLPPLDSPVCCERFTVGSGCMDMYNHVNHVFYIQWALDSLSRQVPASTLPVSIEAVFKDAAVEGDRLKAAFKKAEGEKAWLHAIMRQDDGEELVRLRTRWKKMGAGD